MVAQNEGEIDDGVDGGAHVEYAAPFADGKEVGAGLITRLTSRLFQRIRWQVSLFAGLLLYVLAIGQVIVGLPRPPRVPAPLPSIGRLYAGRNRGPVRPAQTPER